MREFWRAEYSRISRDSSSKKINITSWELIQMRSVNFYKYALLDTRTILYICARKALIDRFARNPEERGQSVQCYWKGSSE
jgi:hypothetical protein